MTPPLLFDLRGKRVYVAGHTGLAGSAIVRRLASEGCEILTADHRELDLTQQDATEKWIDAEPGRMQFFSPPRASAAFTPTILSRLIFLPTILPSVSMCMRAAVAAKVKKLMFLGSSCVFPRNAPQPMTEDLLLTGALEPTNEWYAVAKIAGLKLAEAYRRQFGVDFISVMPTNLYGPGDNYHPENSHVPAALIRRFHEAKVKGANEVVVWGTGKPKREFLAADDLGDACIFVMKHYSGDGFLNIGTGKEVSIGEFARLVAEIVGYRGKLVFDTNRPDGPPRKLLDISKITALGWAAKTPLREGLQAAYKDFLAQGAAIRER